MDLNKSLEIQQIPNTTRPEPKRIDFQREWMEDRSGIPDFVGRIDSILWIPGQAWKGILNTLDSRLHRYDILIYPGFLVGARNDTFREGTKARREAQRHEERHKGEKRGTKAQRHKGTKAQRWEGILDSWSSQE